MFKCKVFAAKPSKPLHVSNEHCDARLKIRIVYMPDYTAKLCEQVAMATDSADIKVDFDYHPKMLMDTIVFVIIDF